MMALPDFSIDTGLFRLGVEMIGRTCRKQMDRLTAFKGLEIKHVQ